MTTAQEIVKNLDDTQAVAMAEKIHNRIFRAIDYADIENSAAASGLSQPLLTLSDDQLDQKLDAETSVMHSRQFLEALSGDPDMAAMIDDAWAQVMNDDDLFVGAIIAVGLIVNLTLFMVSSDIEIDLGKIKIHKGKVDTEAVKAIMEPITKLAGLAGSS